MNNIGIFLGYSSEQPITKEGLGRLLAFLLKEMVDKNEITIYIAMPMWYKVHLYHLLEDHNIEKGKVKVITTRNIPIAIKLFSYLKRKGIKKRKFSIFPQINIFLKNCFVNIIGSRSWLRLSVYLLPLILLLPFFILLIFPILFSIYLKRSNRKVPILSFVSRIINSPKEIRNSAFLNTSYEEMISRELQSLVNIINSRKEVSSWLVPTLFWPEATGIKAKKICVCPDIVMYDFPLQFKSDNSVISLQKLEKTASLNKHFITYSNYVKNNHLINKLCVERENVSVIRHGQVSLSRYLEYNKFNNSEYTVKEKAAEILSRYIATHQWNNIDWLGFDFRREKFIFYASQYRPYKNIISLLEMIRVINCEHGISIRLVLTCDIISQDNLHEYIVKNDLHGLVMSAYNISSSELASLYALASLTINPTLFEGGFPFTFCEAYSVGTPSLMSKIAVVEEFLKEVEVDAVLIDEMLFDPYDIQDLVNKTLHVLGNEAELYAKQKRIYDSFPSWSEVADKYISHLVSVK